MAIRATSGLKFNLWRGEIRHLAARNLFEFQPTLPPLSATSSTSSSTSRQIRCTGKYERLRRLVRTQATPPPPNGGHVISVSKATYHAGLIVDKPPHSPAPVSRHAGHATAGIVPDCRHPAASSPSRRHHLNTPDSDAATSTPSPPPSRRHLDTLPQLPRRVPPPPQPTTTHATNATTTTTCTCRNPPLPPQLPPLPPLPTTTHLCSATAASTQPPSASYRPRPTINAAAAAPTPRATPPNITALALVLAPH
ncbi:hypothetical protein EDB89DRAFT_2066190 [Lactarius sanguifluus]|nr:hypothetical protein EDB89DRAFT_2066190 [Lactarius sanguifluus]